MFHTFFTRKFLLAGESADDFIEVTAQRKAQLEAEEAAWVRPPQQFIDEWCAACGVYGTYNELTGYFELNGLTDITYQQALNIMAYGPIRSYYCSGYLFMPDLPLRTNLPRTLRSRTVRILMGFDVWNCFVNCYNLEVLNLEPAGGIDGDGFIIQLRTGNQIPDYWWNLPALKKVIGVLNFQAFNGSYCGWFPAPNLQELWCRNIHFDCRLFYSLGNIKMECLKFAIENRMGTNAFSLFVPATIYVKLTGDTTNPAAAALSEQELADWMALVPLAAEKNITFVT